MALHAYTSRALTKANLHFAHMVHLCVKVKVKFTLEQSTKAQKGSSFDCLWRLIRLGFYQNPVPFLYSRPRHLHKHRTMPLFELQTNN